MVVFDFYVQSIFFNCADEKIHILDLCRSVNEIKYLEKYHPASVESDSVITGGLKKIIKCFKNQLKKGITFF